MQDFERARDQLNVAKSIAPDSAIDICSRWLEQLRAGKLFEREWKVAL